MGGGSKRTSRLLVQAGEEGEHLHVAGHLVVGDLLSVDRRGGRMQTAPAGVAAGREHECGHQGERHHAEEMPGSHGAQCT